MCSSSTSSPDTGPAQAQQTSEYNASNALAEQQLQQQQAEFDKQYAASQASQAAQLQQAQDEAARQQAASQAALAQQQAQWQAVQDLTKQEDDARTAAAQLDATNQRAYATGRQNLADQYSKQITSEYAGFDDPYYKKFAQQLVDTYAPQIAQNYGDAQRGTQAAFNDAGTLDSTGAARSFAQLAAQNTDANAQLASSATDQASQLKGSIDAQKASTLGALMSSLGVGDPLPAGADPTQALSGLNSRVGAVMSATPAPQVGYAPTYTPPSFAVSTPRARSNVYSTSYTSGLA